MSNIAYFQNSAEILENSCIFSVLMDVPEQQCLTFYNSYIKDLNRVNN